MTGVCAYDGGDGCPYGAPDCNCPGRMPPPHVAAAIAQAVTAHAGEGGAVERAAEVLHGEAHRGAKCLAKNGFGCFTARRARTQAEALAAAGLLAAHAEVGPVGPPLREWNVFDVRTNEVYLHPWCESRSLAEAYIESGRRHLITRQRVVTEWTEVTDD